MFIPRTIPRKRSTYPLKIPMVGSDVSFPIEKKGPFFEGEEMREFSRVFCLDLNLKGEACCLFVILRSCTDSPWPE